PPRRQGRDESPRRRRAGTAEAGARDRDAGGGAVAWRGPEQAARNGRRREATLARQDQAQGGPEGGLRRQEAARRCEQVADRQAGAREVRQARQENSEVGRNVRARAPAKVATARSFTLRRASTDRGRCKRARLPTTRWHVACAA